MDPLKIIAVKFTADEVGKTFEKSMFVWRLSRDGDVAFIAEKTSRQIASLAQW
jgi:hypothetical protein